MTDARLTDVLAGHVLGWRPCPDRFLKTDREWIRRSQFQPTVDLQTAHEVLTRAGARYSLTVRDPVTVARVQVGGRSGQASSQIPARALCVALAAALRLEEAPQ